MYNLAAHPDSRYGISQLRARWLMAADDGYESTVDREIAAVVRREADRRRAEPGTPARRRPLLGRRARRGARSATA